MDFIIDTVGDENLLDKDEVIGEVDENEFANVSEEALSDIINRIKIAHKELQSEKTIDCNQSSKDDVIIDSFFTEMGWANELGTKSADRTKKNRFMFNNIDLDTGKFNLKAASVDVDKEMKKSVLTPGLEQQFSLPEYDVSEKRKKALRKAERDKTKGPSWFNLPAPEITEELKNDLQVLKMRSVLNPKHFYKKNDMEVLPKYFQMGTVMDSALDHHNERLTRKERKRTMVDELLADAEFNRYNKRKYTEIIEEKRKTTYKSYIKDKRLKSKEQFKKNKRESKQKRKG